MNEKEKTISLLVFATYLPLLIRLDILLPAYINSMGGNLAILGFLLSLQQTTSLIMRLPGGYYADKFSRKVIILISNALRSIVSILMVFSSKINHLILPLILRGVGMGLGSSPYLALIGDSSKKSRVGLAFGMERSVRTVFLLLGSLITGKIVDIYGLRIPFFLNSIFFLLGFLIIFKFVRENPQIEKNNHNKDIIKTNTSIAIVPWDSLKILLKNKNILISTVAFFFLFFSQATFLAFFTVHVTDRLGFSYYELGLIISISSAFGFFSNLYTGYLVDRIGVKKILLATGLFRSMMLFLIPFAKTFVQLSFLYLLRAIFFAGPPRNALLTEISQKESRAKVFGAIGIVLDLGKVIGAIVMGIIAEVVSLNSAFFIMGITAILYTLFVAGIKIK